MRDIHEFRKWLDGAFDFVCKLEKQEDPSEWDYIELGGIILVANDNCRRMGAPELTVRVRGYNDGTAICLPNEAKDGIGKMLAWCREREREELNTFTHLTVKQAALYANVCEKTIRRMLNDGRLTRITIGKRGIRIIRQEFDRLSKQQEDLLFG